MGQPEGNRAVLGPAPTEDVCFVSSADGTLQRARFHRPLVAGPVPLLVGLHTWSADYRQRGMAAVEAWCAAQGWAYLHPDFRGPSWSPHAAGSDLVVSDLLDAVRLAFNAVAAPDRRLADADIRFMVEREAIPGPLQQEAELDVGYGDSRVLFRRGSGPARVTIFAGGHEMIESAVVAWLAARAAQGEPTAAAEARDRGVP